ncbi:uncharacterized protein FIBRA_05917 [Fibroporia radiculosa]|uniref:DRBM domain-containing protein n=1 Tax=Fibroporia radiculosa TaxID=599839 RepID=J4GRU9_9APHY|nr:uncharacterized protein FIBRA_05917 [Fibroporia radiculosa]CCM03770.1 predicted protein [Fibroporia radiculosa]
MTANVVRLNNFLQNRHMQHALTESFSSVGPPNQLQWTVTFKLNGQAIGAATAGTKGAAKEQAAGQALTALGA